MKIKLLSGIILENDNREILEPWLKYGAVEVEESISTEAVEQPKRGRKKKDEA